MSLNLNRRQFVLGSAAVLAQMGISNPLSAQAPKLSVPTVDSLTIRVITDSTYDTPRAGGNKWVKVRRSGFISQTDYRKALHNEWGLSLALESKIGTDTRHLMLDFGYTPNALMNNMDIMGIDGAKMQGLIMSHGHFDHFGGLLGYLEKFRTKLPGDLTLYVGGEDNFCNRKTGSGTPGHFSDWGVLDRRDLEKQRVEAVDVVDQRRPAGTGALPIAARGRNLGNRRSAGRQRAPERLGIGAAWIAAGQADDGDRLAAGSHVPCRHCRFGNG